MLSIYEHSLLSSAHRELGERIEGALNSGKRVYLIVPEQQALIAEREMADRLPPSSALMLEVTNFTRFADTMFRRLGGISARYGTPTDEMLIMWRTLTELSANLAVTRRQRRLGISTVARMLAAVKELQIKGISPIEISNAVAPAKATDGRLGEKLADVSMVYTLYKRLMDERFANITDNTASLARRLAEQGELMEGCEVFVDGFTSFTEAQHALLGSLMSICELRVSLPLPGGSRDAFEFSEIMRTEKRLLREADRRSVKKQIYKSAPTEADKGYLLSLMGALLWRASGKIDNDYLHYLNDGGERVRIFSSPTPFEECAFIAADINKRIQGGAAYSDFAIVARDADKYDGILDVALDSAGIPAFFSKKGTVSSLEGIKLIDAAYRIVTRGFRRDDVLAYMKCGLSDVTRRERDTFESYVYKWGVDGRGFLGDTPWFMNPSGYKARTRSDEEALGELNRTRERVIRPLEELREATLKAKTVREHAEVLIGFLDSIELEDRLVQRARELYEASEHTAAEENARLWELICDVLDKLVEALGDIGADAEGFASLLTLVFKESSIGRIPARRDEVTVGSADMLRTYDKKHVYLIGVNHGVFPALPADSSYFTEKDKLSLHRLGLPIEPELELESAKELFFFSRAFCSAEEDVTLIFTERSSSYATLAAGDVIERLTHMTCDAIAPKSTEELPLTDRLWTVNDALVSAEAARLPSVKELLCSMPGGEIVRLGENDITNRDGRLSENTVGILFSDRLYLSQTKLDTFLCCPFSYFAKYGMKLDEGEKAELGASVIGSFIHSVLENFFLKLAEDDRRVSELSDEEKDELIANASGRFISEILSGAAEPRRMSAIKRLCRAARPIVDSLSDEFANCKFTPRLFELPTSGRAADDAEPIVYSTRDGGKAIISGVVDRVDTMKVGDDVYVRVVDYKTGSKVFKPSDIKSGENLQMFLYMKSITETESPAFRERIGLGEGGKMIPAGVIYSHTSVKDITVDHPSDEEARLKIKEQNRGDGMLLDDPVSINAMNPDFLPKKTVKKVEMLDAERLYSADDWKVICDDIENAVLNIVDDMKSGDVSARPKKLASKSYHPCDFCAYKSICRSDEK